jgi:hypothetical protein
VTGPVTRPPSPSPTRPVLTSRTDVETREIPFETRTVRDPALPRGTRRVDTPGVPGVETLRYLVTLADGQPTGRRLIDATVTRQPQHRIVALGTRRPPAQHAGCGQALNICVPLGRRAACLIGEPSPVTSDAAAAEPSAGLPTAGLPGGGLPGGGLPTGGLPTGDLPTGDLPTGGLPGTGDDGSRALVADNPVQIGGLSGADTDLLGDLAC